MDRKQAIVLLLLVLLCGAMAGGCTTVKPRPDYRRAAERIADATGSDAVYQPGDEEAVATKVAELLAGGLTADDSVAVCLLNNPGLQAAFFDVGIARAEVVQSGLLSNPTVGFSLRMPAGGGLANFEAGLAQNLAELWQIPARQRAAERELDRAILQVARQAAVLAVEAKAAYFTAAAADRASDIAEENRVVAQELLDLALARQQAGLGTELDVNLSRSELRETELARRSARLAAFEARSTLATVLGLPGAPDQLEMSESLPESTPAVVPVERLAEIADAHRLDLAAARQAVDGAAANVALERSRVFPTLEIGVGLEREARDRARGRKLLAETVRSSLEAGELSPPSLEREEAEGGGFIIGPTIEVELPIFDQNQAQIAKAEYAYEQAARVLDGLVRQTAQEVRLAHEKAATAAEVAEFYQAELLPLAENNLEMLRESYRAGKRPRIAVLDAQRTLIAARGRYVEALRGAAAALTDLEKATGQPLNKILKTTATTQPAVGRTDEPVATQPAAPDGDRNSWR